MSNLGTGIANRGQVRLGGPSVRPQEIKLSGIALPSKVSKPNELVDYLLSAPSRIADAQTTYYTAKAAADKIKVTVATDALRGFDGVRSNEETRKAAVEAALNVNSEYVDLAMNEIVARTALDQSVREFEAAKLVAEITKAAA